MKIRQPWLIKLIGLLGAAIIRAWLATICPRFRFLGNTNPYQPGLKKRYIYVFWHENMLLPCHYFSRRDIKVLISQHADGELIAQVCRNVGFGVIRGSTTRGSIPALRQMLEASKKSHIAVTPDGPRGPRRRVEKGVIYLAARTGLPIVVAGIAYDKPWRLPTWDRFALPRPWSKATLILFAPIAIPPDLDRDQLEHYRQMVENEMERARVMAERSVNG